jgi:mycothiol synthase
METKFQDRAHVELPAGFTARGALMDDLQPSLQLFNRWSRTVIGRDEFASTEPIRQEWQASGVDIAEDVRHIFAPDGELIGHVEVWTNARPLVHPELWARLDPRYEQLGIGTWMMHWAEERVLRALPSVPEGLRFSARVGVYRQVEKAKRLFEEMGYQYIRSWYHMLIEMDAPVPEPEFPKGITLRTYDPETDREAAHRAHEDAFRDHFGHIDLPLEEGLKRWKQHREYEGYDPTLYFLAIDEPSGEIAGFNLCRPNSHYDLHRGWVSAIGVRRPWRKRGLGLALLRQAFNEFYRRGKHKVGLGVDAQNLTGALRLYEIAGMHIDLAHDFYEKELRPGKEISVESLSE